jgi:DNA-binding MarR family transcriptional regulator
MDMEILSAIWFSCNDLNDSEHKLLLALAHHCHHSLSCWPSVPRLSQMIRRTERQTHTLLYRLEKKGYITIVVRKGRGHSNLYHLNRKRTLPYLDKTGSPEFRSKPEIQTSDELLLEEERKEEQNPEDLLLKLGLTRGSVVWIAAMNGHQK